MPSVKIGNKTVYGGKWAKKKGTMAGAEKGYPRTVVFTKTCGRKCEKKKASSTDSMNLVTCPLIDELFAPNPELIRKSPNPNEPRSTMWSTSANFGNFKYKIPGYRNLP